MLRLIYEFFKTGLFSIGGGLATIPFLAKMGESFGYFTQDELLTMIAVSESTPGPIGINMATFAGIKAGVGAASFAKAVMVTTTEEEIH